MADISKFFEEQVSSNPEKEYSVLITLKNDKLPSRLLGKGEFVMADTIFSARISGKEIQSLKNDDEIEAIEPDEAMGIL
ncbi:hypothetical protein [Segetibacter sp.]|jgi:hypothetical protein|uniref:hypothetical protein n=1 Tax=Segetibacter sp. TaxID=2231182 RepID=UPI00262E4BB1|nr:hypothetical protein [Segetibacter sp.]MCW3080913.1 hypothetical protein [Segetibacter sp.]